MHEGSVPYHIDGNVAIAPGSMLGEQRMRPNLHGLQPWPPRLAAGFASCFLAERERWVLWTPALLGLGIAAYFALPADPPIWLAPVIALSAAAAAVAGRRQQGALLGCLVVIIVAGGFAAADLRTRTVAAPVLAKRLGPAAVEGRIAEVMGTSEGRRLVIEAPKISRLAPEKTPQRVRLSLPGDNGSKLVVGDLVRLRAMLMPPPGPVAPGAFDFARQAWFEGLGAVGFAVGTAERIAASKDGRFSLAAAVGRLRQHLAERIRLALPGPAGAVAAALMTGDRGAIPEAVLAAMRESGLAHLLAISGLHIGLVASLLFFAVRALLACCERLALRRPIKKWSAVAALLGAFAYLTLTGATVPTQRAFVMVALVLLAVLTDRSALSMRTVAWAALAILLLTPESLLSVSFQMSFAAVVALIATYEHFGPRLAAWRRQASWPRRAALYVAGIAVTTVVASLATMPFAAYHFNQISHYGLAANLLAVPLMALWIMPWAIATFLLVPFGLEAVALAPMGAGITAMLTIASTVASWPGAVSRLPSAPTPALALLVLGGLWLCLWSGRWRWAGVAPIALACALGLSARPPDLLIDDSGRLAAVRTPDGGLGLSRRASGYASDTWLRRAGQFTAAGDGGFVCDRAGCIAEREGELLAYVRDGRALAEDCRRAEVVLSAVPVRRRCPARLVVDRFDLWREGAHAIWLDGHVLQIETVAELRGNRPWARSRGRARWRKAQ